MTVRYQDLQKQKQRLEKEIAILEDRRKQALEYAEERWGVHSVKELMDLWKQKDLALRKLTKELESQLDAYEAKLTDIENDLPAT